MKSDSITWTQIVMDRTRSQIDPIFVMATAPNRGNGFGDQYAESYDFIFDANPNSCTRYKEVYPVRIKETRRSQVLEETEVSKVWPQGKPIGQILFHMCYMSKRS